MLEVTQTANVQKGVRERRRRPFQLRLIIDSTLRSSTRAGRFPVTSQLACVIDGRPTDRRAPTDYCPRRDGRYNFPVNESATRPSVRPVIDD